MKGNVVDLRKKSWIYYLCITTFYFLTRKETISSFNLNLDEILSWHLASLSWRELIQGVYGDTQQPAYYLFLKTALHVLPAKNDFWVRFPSVLLGLAFFFVLYNLLENFFNKPTAVLTTLLLMSHQELKNLSIIARPYMLIYFLIAVNLFSILLVCYRNKNGAKYRNIFFVTSVLMCLTHYLSCFYLFSVLMGLLITKKIKILMDLKSRQGSLLISFSLLYAFGISYQFQYMDRLKWILSFEESYDSAIVELLNVLPIAGFSNLIVGSLFLIFVLYKKVKNKDEDRLEMVFLVTHVLGGLFFFYAFSKLITPVFIGRYLMVCLPAISILIGHVLFFLKPTKLAISAIVLLILYSYFVSNEKNRNSWRFDGKEFLTQIYNHKYIKFPASVLCNTPGQSAYKLYANYSLIYFPKDICSSYRYFSNEEISSNFTYIINLKSSIRDHVYDNAITNYRHIYSSQWLELYKRNE